MSAGLKRLVVGVVGVGAAIVGVAIAGHVGSGANGGLKPYGLRETLPQMVASFGTDARVVEIIVGSSGVYYQVIGADRRLHIRDYSIVQSEIEAGTYGYSRKTRDFVRALTPAEAHSAVVTLGQVDPGVVDGLYGKVGFPRQGIERNPDRALMVPAIRRPTRASVRRGITAAAGFKRTQAAAPPDPDTATIPSAAQVRAPTSSTRVKRRPAGPSTASRPRSHPGRRSPARSTAPPGASLPVSHTLRAT